MLSRWRSGGRKKMKIEFMLMFQVSQVPRSKKSTLTISLMPENLGKPTLKLEKATVQDGTCTWENPVYETVKLIRDSKTGSFNENIYHFIVSSGSSKSGFLGEASIDFADFALEIEPLTVSLPLKFANSGAILHVTIQKMPGDADQRGEENEDMTISQDIVLESQLNNCKSGGNNLQTFYDGDMNISGEENGKFRSPNGSSTSLALYWDNNLEHAIKDIAMENTSVNDDASHILSHLRQNSMPQRGLHDAKTAKKARRRSDTDWSMGSVSNGSLVDSTTSLEDNHQREASSDTVDDLKCEISILKRQAELSELEIDSLRKQIIKESKRGQNLSTQVVCLTGERDLLKTECDTLKSFKKCSEGPKQEKFEMTLEETRRELSFEKDLNMNFKLQLQKTQDSNSELLLAVSDLNDMLEEKNIELSHLSSKTEELPRQNDFEEIDILREKCRHLSGEIEYYQKYVEDTGSLGNKELESEVKMLEEKLKNQEQELSESLERHVKHLENELEEQAQRFKEDLDAMTRSKIEQEQKAIQAEGALRKSRWNNANTAERLQEEFRRLSVEMSSKFDENEKLTMKLTSESNELHCQNKTLEEMLAKAKEEVEKIKDQCDVELQEVLNQIDLKENKIEEMSLQLDCTSKQVEYSSKEIQILRDEIESLKRENCGFSEQMNASTAEIEMLLKRWNAEKDILEEKYASAKKEVETLQEELTIIMSSKDEKETMARNMMSEVQGLRAEYDELQRGLVKAEKEKENLRKQVLGLKVEMQKKEEEITNIEDKLTHKCGKKEISDAKKISRNMKSTALPPESKEVADLKMKLKFLEEQIQLKEATLQNSSNSFLEKERNLNRKIEELNTSMEQLKQNRSSNTDKVQKGCSARVEETCSQSGGNEYMMNKDTNTPVGMSNQYEAPVLPLERKVERCTENISKLGIGDGFSLTESLGEVTLLKECNKSMESELKELQERYSEMSLKFAEVEGERQQLVMTVRNLKSGKKN